MKKILFCLNHPSDFFTFKNVIPRLDRMGYTIKVLFTPQNIVANLPWTEEWDCINLYQTKRKQNFISSFVSIWSFIRQYRPDIVTGTDPILAHASKWSGARSILINQLDSKVRPGYKSAYRCAKKIISPDCCDKNIFPQKKIIYRGCHQMAYLRNKYFKPDENVKTMMGLKKDKYFIIRLSSQWNSNEGSLHGLDPRIIRELINLFEMYGQVFISSGRNLADSLKPYELNLPPEQLHNALYYSEMLISDAETMAGEAAVLGVPSIWISPHVGKISYMNELEEKYGLTFGVPMKQPKRLASAIKELLNTPDIRTKWKNKRKVMLVETEDVAEFLIDAIRIYAEKQKV